MHVGKNATAHMTRGAPEFPSAAHADVMPLQVAIEEVADFEIIEVGGAHVKLGMCFITSSIVSTAP